MSAPDAVFLDALGTLVRLESPTPRLQASLRARVGLDVDEDLASAAMRAEMRYYAANCIRARTTPHSRRSGSSAPTCSPTRSASGSSAPHLCRA